MAASRRRSAPAGARAGPSGTPPARPPIVSSTRQQPPLVGDPLTVEIDPTLLDQPPRLAFRRRQPRRRPPPPPSIRAAPRASSSSRAHPRTPSADRTGSRPSASRRTGSARPVRPAASSSAPCTIAVTSRASRRCASRASGASTTARSSSSIAGAIEPGEELEVLHDVAIVGVQPELIEAERRGARRDPATPCRLRSSRTWCRPTWSSAAAPARARLPRGILRISSQPAVMLPHWSLPPICSVQPKRSCSTR